MTGRWVDVEIGGDEWSQLMTASKVAAVLGVSTYESPRSLWHLMRGDVDRDPQTTSQARGHYLEPAVLAWFFDQHPGVVRHYPMGATFVADDGWRACSPDAFAVTPAGVLPVEAKSEADGHKWGAPGTDEIPIGYMAQCMWTMHVLGAERCFVPMIGPRLEFAEYVVEYSPELGASIEAICRAFMDSLTTDAPPDVDSHPATYESLRRVSPLIDDGTVEVDEDTARLFIWASTRSKASKADMSLANATIAELMGTARKATYMGEVVATRQNSSTGVPYVKAARTLPDLGATP